MTVDTTTAAHRSTFEGQTYYFCSPSCKRTFDANPAHYTKESVPMRGAGAAGDSSTTHAAEQDDPPITKSHGFVAPKFGSAGSGGAEYEPLPERHDRDERK